MIDGVNALYYDLNKITLNRGESYIDSPEWVKNKKATINPENDDDKCFQYALKIALNYQNIKKNPQRISNIKLFIHQYNWNEIDFPRKVRIGESLNQIINQLLLIFCMFPIIVKK